MKSIERIELQKALIVAEACKYSDRWVGFPYNRNVTEEEVRAAEEIKRQFVKGLIIEKVI
jgi:hypothetical protein